MKKSIVYLAICLALGAFAWAQSSTASDAAQSAASQTAGAANQQQIEGCIVKQETAYYIQPVTGGAPTKLNAGGQDLSAHVGQHVNVTGSKTSSAGGAMAGATGGKDSGGEFLVSRIDVVETNCPMGTQNPQGATQPKPQ